MAFTTESTEKNKAFFSKNVYENRLVPVAHPPSGVRFGPNCIPRTNRSAEGGRATEFSYTF